MPTADRKMRPRRRRDDALAFQTQLECEAAAAEVRNAYPTLDAAESSPEWARVRPAIMRWITNLPMWRNSNSPIHSPERASAIAVIFLRRPELLPPMGPTG